MGYLPCQSADALFCANCIFAHGLDCRGEKVHASIYRHFLFENCAHLRQISVGENSGFFFD